MALAATLAFELHAADGTDDMALAVDLVDEKALLVDKVLVALAAVVMGGRDNLVLDHLLDRAEGTIAADDGAADFARGAILRHDEVTRG